MKEYEGEYTNDKRNGERTYYYESGFYYIGQWLNNEEHGKGIINYPNGKKMYEGYFLNGKKEGSGTLYYENEKLGYCGLFKNNKFEVVGILLSKEGKLLS